MNDTNKTESDVNNLQTNNATEIETTTTETTSESAGVAEKENEVANSEVATEDKTPAVEDKTAENTVGTNVATETIAKEAPVEEAVSAATETAPAMPAAPVSPAGSNVLKHYAIAFAIILCMGLGLWYMMEEQGRVDTGVFDSIKSAVVPAKTVAIVNGEKLTVIQLERNKGQLRAAALQQGLDPASPEVAAEVDKQAIELMINTALLTQAAKEVGIEVSQADIDARYNEIVTELGDEAALTARMAELGMTKEGLLEDISGELLIQKHLESALKFSEITIGEADIKAYYDELAKNPAMTNLPKFDEAVAEQIKAQMEQEKQQTLIAEHLANLKKEAEIEIVGEEAAAE